MHCLSITDGIWHASSLNRELFINATLIHHVKPARTAYSCTACRVVLDTPFLLASHAESGLRNEQLSVEGSGVLECQMSSLLRRLECQMNDIGCVVWAFALSRTRGHNVCLQVTAATTQTMLLLTSSASSIVYAQLGDTPWDWASVMLPMAFAATLAGQVCVWGGAVMP